MEPISLSAAGADFFASPHAAPLLERELLPHYLPGCRWFGGKARSPQRFEVEERVALNEGSQLLLVRVEYAAGPAETYLLPLRASSPGSPGAGEPIAAFSDGWVLAEALGEESFRRELIHLIATEGSVGPLHGSRGPALPENAASLPSKVLKVEQSNSSLLYGSQVFMKLFRKLEEGLNPDVEIIRFLNGQRLEHVPPFAGALELHRPGQEPRVLALALGLIENEGDAWAQTLGEVREFYGRVLEQGGEALPPPPLFGSGEPSPALLELAGTFAHRVRQLGIRTGQLHLALAAPGTGSAFTPEPFTTEDQQELSAGVRELAGRVFEQLGSRELGQELLQRRERLEALAVEIGRREVRTAKTRTHGDYHLGQVLNTGSDFVIIDFEGEPQRSLAERKKKRSPLRDVAGMLRSFHYAAHSGLGEFEAERAKLEPWAESWAGLMSRLFLQAWLETCAGASFLPADPDEIELLLKSFLLEKAIYEVGYELNNRPAWVGIPIRGIVQILDA